MVFDKIRWITAGHRNRPHLRYTVRPSSHAIHKITHAWHSQASVFSRLSQMMLQKCSKMQHIFAYNGLPWELPPHNLHF